mmetsp:Transcript_2546/g.5369  ORF Transcript_2546/g.5369 Transcript_2546/m.5369 type:complete len:203 (-) Transcript_2546:86-694(-)
MRYVAATPPTAARGAAHSAVSTPAMVSCHSACTRGGAAPAASCRASARRASSASRSSSVARRVSCAWVAAVAVSRRGPARHEPSTVRSQATAATSCGTAPHPVVGGAPPSPRPSSTTAHRRPKSWMVPRRNRWVRGRRKTSSPQRLEMASCSSWNAGSSRPRSVAVRAASLEPVKQDAVHPSVRTASIAVSRRAQAAPKRIW